MGNFFFDEEGKAVKSGVTASIHNMTDPQLKAREIVLDSFETSRNGKGDWDQQMIKNYESYHQLVKEAEEEDEGEKKARISTPDTFGHVEGVLAKQRAAIFPTNLQEQLIRALPQNLDSIEFVDKNEALLNYQFRRMDIRSDRGTIWLRTYLMYGIAPIFPYWRYEERTIPYREPIQVQNPMTGESLTLGYGAPQDRTLVYFNGPDFNECDPIEDWFPDPTALAFQPHRMRYAQRRYYLPYERLKLQTEQGRFDKSMFDLVDKNSVPPGSENLKFDRRNPFRRRDAIEFVIPKGAHGIVELIEHHTREWIITVANRNIPLSARRKPYYLGEMAMICPTRLRMTNETLGKSVLEPIVPIHNIINALANLRLDNLRFAVQKMWTIIQGSIPKEKLKSTNRILEVMDHDDIKERDTKDVTGGVYKEMEVLLGNMEKATGLNSGATADAANIRSGLQQIAVSEITGERNQMDIDAFVHGGLIPLAHTAYTFNQQFLTDDIVVPVLGSDFNTSFIQVPIEALFGDFQFSITAAAKSVPTVVEARQKLELVNSMVTTLIQFPDLLTMLYKQIAQDAHYTELAKVLDVISGIIGNVRAEGGNQLTPGGQQNQEAQGAAGFVGSGGSPSSDLGSLLGNIDSTFGGV